MQDIVFGKKKETEVIVKPKTKFIPCVKNDKNKISIKKEDAVLIGKIDIKHIPVIKETEEIQCFLENSNGFYDGKTFGNIENAIDVSKTNIEEHERMSKKFDNMIFDMMKNEFGCDISNIEKHCIDIFEGSNKVYYKVKTVKEFIKI